MICHRHAYGIANELKSGPQVPFDEISFIHTYPQTMTLKITIPTILIFQIAYLLRVVLLLYNI